MTYFLVSTIPLTAIGSLCFLVVVYYIATMGVINATAKLRTLVSKRSSLFSHIKFILNGESDLGPLSRADVYTYFHEGTWQRKVFTDYECKLMDRDRIFPCVYATMGLKADQQRYAFIDSDDLSDPRHARSLSSVFSAYIPITRDLGPNTSLVILAKDVDSTSTVEGYNLRFWKLMDNLAKLDPAPWPAHVPKDIDTDKWCFCFGGECFFAVVMTPAHRQRASRHSNGITMIFQPRWVLDELLSTEAKRNRAQSTVRGLLAKYDPIPVSPFLAAYGSPGNRESEQYYLLDEDIPAPRPYDRLSESQKVSTNRMP